MPKIRLPHPDEFRNRIVEFARNGRTPGGLAEEPIDRAERKNGRHRAGEALQEDHDSISEIGGMIALDIGPQACNITHM